MYPRGKRSRAIVEIMLEAEAFGPGGPFLSLEEIFEKWDEEEYGPLGNFTVNDVGSCLSRLYRTKTWVRLERHKERRLGHPAAYVYRLTEEFAEFCTRGSRAPSLHIVKLPKEHMEKQAERREERSREKKLTRRSAKAPIVEREDKVWQPKQHNDAPEIPTDGAGPSASTARLAALQSFVDAFGDTETAIAVLCAWHDKQEAEGKLADANTTLEGLL